MDTEDLRHQIKQMGDLLALCLTEQRAVLAKFEQVSADLSAVASAVAPRPKLSTRDWNTELAVLGHWHWSPPTRLHGWWAMPTNPHSAFDVVPLRDVTTLWAKRAREAHPEVAKLVDERDDVERGR
ncbi:MAG: hypothetical protein IPK74_39630 [Deltaproteobacteria bacterium]|nr:hypothetical protein [Deltaproteobacteria bacterium]